MSNVPEGYKLSKVGVIPEEWEVKTLGEKTTKIGSGITPTGGEKVYKSKGRPFLRSQNVGLGNLILKDIAFISDEIHNTFKATEIEKNDVFLNITGASIGRSAIADERVQNGNVNQHVCIIRTIEDELNPNFLNYFLLSKKGQKQIDSFQAGGNRQGLNFGQIKSFQIPLPPHPEQQAIASALSEVDALITALEQLITKKRNIKQGAMQQLLTGEKRLPGFGGAWEVKKLGEVGSFSKGKGIRKDEVVSEGLPCIRYGEIYTTHNNYIKSFKSFITQSLANESIEIKTGDLLFAGSGETAEEIGKCVAFVGDEKVFAGGDIVILRPSSINNNSLFLGFLLNNPIVTKQKVRMGQGDAVVHISGKNLSEIQIPLPPTKDEQTAIAQILTDMDAEIEALEQKQAKYKAIKQGMMQELLTGKTRLV